MVVAVIYIVSIEGPCTCKNRFWQHLLFLGLTLGVRGGAGRIRGKCLAQGGWTLSSFMLCDHVAGFTAFLSFRTLRLECFSQSKIRSRKRPLLLRTCPNHWYLQCLYRSVLYILPTKGLKVLERNSLSQASSKCNHATAAVLTAFSLAL